MYTSYPFNLSQYSSFVLSSGVKSKHGPTLSGRIQKTNELSPEMKLCFIALEVTPKYVVFIGSGNARSPSVTDCPLKFVRFKLHNSSSWRYVKTDSYMRLPERPLLIVYRATYFV